MKSLVSSLLLAAGVFAASSAIAYNPSGNSTAGPGATQLTYGGVPVPCHSTFTINVPAPGSPTGTVVGASFTTQSGDSPTCPNITPNKLPWSLGPASATGTAGVYTATISGISVTVPRVATCTGSVAVTLDNNTHQASFSGTLHDAGGRACGVSGSGLGNPIIAP